METSVVENKRNETDNTVRSECSVAEAIQTTFSRANVVAQAEKVRLVDADEESGLELYCYNRCSNEEDDFIKGCRGLVFHGEKLVMKAFSYTDEYNHTEIPVLEKVLSNFSKWSFYTAYEGALLRLFYFSGKWFLSTHRKLNAFRSKWSSHESFGTLFKKALENEASINQNFFKKLVKRVDEGENILDMFQASLDKTKQYMFLLRNSSDNRIVCFPPSVGDHFIFHVGTIFNNQLSMEDDIGLLFPEKKYFMNVEQLVNHIESNIDFRYHQGIVCFGSDGRHVKVLHKEYQDFFRARGNEPSIKFRYLQVRMNKKITDLLYHLYPEMAETFDDYENTIYDIARSIYRAYVQRFIKKRYVTVPREEYQVINECHTWHLSDRENNRISLDKIIGMLNKQPPTNLNHMIRRFKTEQAKKVMQPRSYKGSRGNSVQNSPAIIGADGNSVEPLILLKRTTP
jgi:hypothetical protein